MADSRRPLENRQDPIGLSVPHHGPARIAEGKHRGRHELLQGPASGEPPTLFEGGISLHLGPGGNVRQIAKAGSGVSVPAKHGFYSLRELRAAGLVDAHRVNPDPYPVAEGTQICLNAEIHHLLISRLGFDGEDAFLLFCGVWVRNILSDSLVFSRSRKASTTY